MRDITELKSDMITDPGAKGYFDGKAGGYYENPYNSEADETSYTDYKNGFDCGRSVLASEVKKAAKKTITKSKIEVGDEFECMKNFIMENGEIAFTENHFYHISEIGSIEVLFEHNDQGYIHWMPYSELNEYFRQVIK